MTDQALDDLARRVMLDAARLEYGDLLEELPEHDFSPEFERKMKHLIRQADHPARHRLLRTGQLVAALVALLLLLTVATAAAGYDITPELEHRKSGYVERKRRPYQGNVVRIA